MENKNNRTISRRDFFKIAGAAGMATAGLTACGDRQGSLTSANAGEPGGEMTYRTLTGDRVSLLGYGCMRWPMMPNPDGEGQVVDVALYEPILRMLDELVQLIPQDIYLTAFKTANNQVTLNGVARSDVVISEFMRSIRDAKRFGEPVLQIIETKNVNNNVQARVFELIVPLKLGADQVGAGGKT